MKPVQTMTSFKKEAWFINAEYNVGMQFFYINFLVGCVKGMEEIKKFRGEGGTELGIS